MQNHEHKATILIVDDTASNIQVAAEVLSKDYQIRIAINGMEALQTFESFHVDLVLLDIQMPGMDGFEVCRRMKTVAGKENIPVIFATTSHAAEDKAAAIEAGGVDYITKPINFTMLRERINKHLGQK